MSAVVGEDLFSTVNYEPARQGEIHRTFCDISLARAELGFNPSTPLRAGLATTWEWFKERPGAARRVSEKTV